MANFEEYVVSTTAVESLKEQLLRMQCLARDWQSAERQAHDRAVKAEAAAHDCAVKTEAAVAEWMVRALTAERAEQVATERLIIAMKAPSVAAVTAEPERSAHEQDGSRRTCTVCGDSQRAIYFRLRLETRNGGSDDAYICDADAPKVLAAVRALREREEYPAVDPIDLLCGDA